MKRLLFIGVIIAAVLSCSLSTVYASSEIRPYASLTLSDYEASLSPGKSSGSIYIDYDVTATRRADLVGVSSIAIYKSDGTMVADIEGTTDNNLLRESSGTNMGSYTYYGTSGTLYYAKVTVYAKIGQNEDSRVITTSTIKAP